MRLTQKATAALTLPVGKTDHFEWDDEMPGFGYRLRLAAGGKIARTWTVQYRHGGATRRLLLGSAAVLGAVEARVMAKKALGRVANSADPQADRLDRRGKDRHTLKATVADYLAIKQRDVRGRTFVEKARYLTDTRYFGPLHSLALDQITRKDVAARLNRITLESGSIVAASARAQISALFTWALAHGLCEANPVVGTLAPKGGQPRERVLDDSELARIWRACGDDDYGRCIKLLVLSGCRRQEIGGMCWSEIDLDRGAWVLPAARSKNARAHTLPLLSMALDIIKAVPRMVARDQLFGQRGGGFTGWARGKAVLDAASGVKDWTTHDIRRSVATKLADIGVMPHVIEQILNHQSGHKRGPAGVYNRSSYTNEVRNALALWHDHVRTLVEGGERKVISLPQVAS
jgi:integrase